MPFAANVTVELAGVCVTPGDYIYVDATGGVVIPAASLLAVLDTAREVDGEDAAAQAAIRQE
jgi:regulator of RNase E activity RraA